MPTIVYKNGKLHADADALSRYPVGGANDLDEEITVAAVSIGDTREALKATQREVLEWEIAFEQLKLGLKTHPTYEIKNELLYVLRPHLPGNEWKLYIPSIHNR